MEKRYNEYMENQSGWTELIRNTKQREIQDMGARIQEFQENAQKQLQQREQELLKPIIDRAKKAITDVAAEGGYSYIFDSGVSALLYSPDSDDIMPLVKKKLGLK
jgi:outer membrane protein